MNRSGWIVTILFTLFVPFSTHAASDALVPQPYIPTDFGPQRRVVWVAPNGSDTLGLGTKDRPFLTIARAADTGNVILLRGGRHTHFGTILRGGSPQEPLLIRPESSTSTVEIALQDATEPATIGASHIRIEGITIHGNELETPGACLALKGDVDDLTLANVRIRGCRSGIDVGRGAWTHGVLEDTYLTDLQESAIDCHAGACIHQRLTRVRMERIGSTPSSTAVTISDRSQDIRWRDVVLRDVTGNGARFVGARPSIANTQFLQIRGTSLELRHGGYLARVDIGTGNEGLRARVGSDLVIERSLLRTLAVTSTPLIIEDDPGDTFGTLLIAYSRIEVPTSTLVLGGLNSHHDVVWQSSAFWFHQAASSIALPGDARIPAEEALSTALIAQEGRSQVLFGVGTNEERFSPFFEGGDTTYHENGSRTITSGSQLRGEQSSSTYVLGVDDHAHFIPSEAQRLRWYTQGTINMLSEARLGDIPRGYDLTEPPGTLVKTNVRPQVYLVTAPNTLRWIQSEEIALAYAGPRWAKTIVTLAPEEITQYEEREPIVTRQDLEMTDVLRQVPDPGDLFDSDDEPPSF